MEAEDPQWISTSSGHQVAKDAALDALLANEAHRSKLREHILKLQAALAEADQLVEDAEKVSEKEKAELDEVELKCIRVQGARSVFWLSNLWKDEKGSSLRQDAVRRQQAIELTRTRPWSRTERRYLKETVINEHKRAYAVQLKAEGGIDVIDAVKLVVDDEYERWDASEFDWEGVSKKLQSMMPVGSSPRSAAECQIQWLNNDRPTISKGPWSASEVQALVTAVTELRTPSKGGEGDVEDEDGTPSAAFPEVDWAAVSAKLGGSRTPVQCFQRWLNYRDGGPVADDVGQSSVDPEEIAMPHPTPTGSFTSLASTPSAQGAQKPARSSSKVGGKRLNQWSTEEDEMLVQLVQEHGAGNWALVASKLPFERSAKQCSERYRVSLDPSIRRTKWTTEEDEALRKAFCTLGPKWSVVKDYVPGRTASQCRERWVNVVNPGLKKGQWTAEEDQTILRLRDEGLEWSAIAKEMPGRADGEILRRHRKLVEEPKQSTWTTEDDRKLLEVRKQNPTATFNDIAPLVGDGKTGRQCAARYKTLTARDQEPAAETKVSADEEVPSTAPVAGRKVKPKPKPKARPKPTPKVNPKRGKQSSSEPEGEEVLPEQEGSGSATGSRKRKRPENEDTTPKPAISSTRTLRSRTKAKSAG